jgi:3-deoxy-manno-octulosonate cytidylyltransferase (CMP-KDO synthetase)
MAEAVAVIPARYASVRFPGKVLADRTGKPLVQHVYEQVAAARQVARVVVAADDRRIVDAVEGFGGEAVMTRADHPNGTSRIAEVAPALAAGIVVNVQADEPEIEPGLIDLAVQDLGAHPTCVASTLAAPFTAAEDPADPNIVKVVIGAAGTALYFSRALIPHDRDGTAPTRPLKHVGMYVYRREFLETFTALPPTPLERAERLEQLRILEHGYDIAVTVADVRYHGIDTPQQYDEFVHRFSLRAS